MSKESIFNSGRLATHVLIHVIDFKEDVLGFPFHQIGAVYAKKIK